MTVALDHLVIWCSDQKLSADFYASLLDRPAPVTVDRFRVVALDNGTSLDFLTTAGSIAMQHYAFRVTGEAFDGAFARMKEGRLPYWGDPARTMAQQTYLHDGDRGFYFMDPDGHLLEIIAAA